jgi:DNA-binding response OmpR family regulator
VHGPLAERKESRRMTRKILLVDDEPEFVEMIQMRLEANGYQVVTAHNGEDGIQKAQEENPRLILLDVMMPGMDGMQTLHEIRRTPGIKDIPVVMLTAKGESKSIFKAQDRGATDYLIKPCESKDLLDIARKYA